MKEVKVKDWTGEESDNSIGLSDGLWKRKF